jgi:aerobic carbon-monoxide dehydrogenase large subunit
MSLVNRYIGSPIKRVEDLRFLRGRGEYVADLASAETLHTRPSCAAPVARARIRAIDLKPALAIAGVHAVITATEIGIVPKIPLRLQPCSATEPFCQPVIAQDRVRYVGEPIAVVLANSAALAENGVEAIALDLEEEPIVADWSISHRGETLLFEDAGTNRAMQFTAIRGDADAAFRGAEYTRRAHFSVQRHTALPLEPRGLLAEWDGAAGRLTVKGAAKVPFFNRRTVAQMMGLSEPAVDLIENDVGGGFGARGEFYPEDFLIPFAARYVGRPVVWIENRREHLIAINHARQMDCDVEIACKRDGTILGLRGDVHVDLGAYVRTNSLIAPRNVVQLFSGPYRVPNIRLSSSALVTNKTPTGTYRAPGRYEGSFFCERLIELAAKDLGIDSIEMRRRNLVTDAEMPYRLARVEPADLATETECDSGDYPYRGPLSRRRGCLLRRGWWYRPQGECTARIGTRWHGDGLCGVGRGRAGARDDHRPDCCRCAGSDDRQNSRSPRLDHLSRRRLRLLCLALDGIGRISGVRGGSHTPRKNPYCRSKPSGLSARGDRDYRWHCPDPTRSLYRAGGIGNRRAQGRCQLCE